MSFRFDQQMIETWLHQELSPCGHGWAGPSSADKKQSRTASHWAIEWKVTRQDGRLVDVHHAQRPPVEYIEKRTALNE